MAIVRYKMGGYAEVGDRAAKNLVNSGFWEYADDYAHEERVVEVETAQSHANATNTQPEGNHTPEHVRTAEEPTEAPEEADKDERPDVSVVRAWAKQNDIEVSAKGRVSAEVYEKYAEAVRAKSAQADKD